jgi:hypothetical protein
MIKMIVICHRTVRCNHIEPLLHISLRHGCEMNEWKEHVTVLQTAHFPVTSSPLPVVTITKPRIIAKEVFRECEL